MRKIAAFVLLVLFCVTLFPCRFLSAENGAELSLTETEAAPGDTVHVERSGNPGIISLKIKIGYVAAELTLLSAESGGAFEEMGYIGAQTIDVNPYIMVWSRAADVTGDGSIGFLTFRVSETASPGTAALTLTCDFCTNQALQDVAVTTRSGSVRIFGDSTASAAPSSPTPAAPTGNDASVAPQQTPGASPDSSETPSEETVTPEQPAETASSSEPGSPNISETISRTDASAPAGDDDTSPSRLWLLLLLLLLIAAVAAAFLIYRKKRK